jgi:sulfonate transport system ATP-binding protein
LLDEPFGALDALTRREMHELLGRIWQRDGFTTVLITHDVSEAVTLAGRVLVLREGRFTLDRQVPGPRPHDPADPRLAELAKRVLAAV